MYPELKRNGAVWIAAIRIICWWVLYLCGGFSLLMAAKPEVREFNVPAGPAFETLHMAALQGEVEILFTDSTVQGVTTREVQGVFTASKALEQMVKGTQLRVNMVRENAAYAISLRKEPAELQGADPDKPPTQTNTIEMNTKRNNWLRNLVTVLTLGIGSGAGAQDVNDEETIFELSPFEVDASQDIGYRAINTLAGSRLNTNLADVGSSISVMTQEFIEDLGVTDLNNALVYAMNTEAGGEMGNFSDGETSSHSVRSNPDERQRVRGLSEATRTRNFFITDIPMDSYNTSRLTISRGPNSLLFGIGSPGGVIDNSLTRASRAATFSEFSSRLGEHGANRWVLKHNQALLDNRLGVFVAALRDRHEYNQRPAFEDTDRYYFAFNALLHQGEDGGFLGNTILHGNFEDGEIYSERPQNNLHNSRINWWFDPPSVQKYAAYEASVPAQWHPGNFVPKYMYDWENPDNPAPALRGRAIGFSTQVALAHGTDGQLENYYPGTFGIEGLIRGTDPNTGERIVWDHFQVIDWRPASPYLIRGGRTIPYSIWDHRKHLLVPGGLRTEQDFDAYNLTLEQTFLDGDAGIEIAYDEQRYDESSQYAGVNDFIHWMTVDINEKLADGSPNPNAGRPMIRSHNVQVPAESDNRETFRATLYYELDLQEQEGWVANLGTHRFTGFFNNQSHLYRWERGFLAWDGPDVDRIWPGQDSIRSGQRFVNFNHYVGPDLRNVNSYADVRLTGGGHSILDYETAAPIPVTVWDDVNQGLFNTDLTIRRNIREGALNLTEVDSSVFSWQGTWFDGHLVTLYGRRDDESKTFRELGTSNFPDGSINPNTTYVLSDTPTLTAEGETETKSVVAHLPEDWNPISEQVGISFHWAESENFAPTSLRKNLRNEQIPPESGVTDEMGITFHLLDNRLFARLNLYETSQKDATGQTSGGLNDLFVVGSAGLLGAFARAQADGIEFADLWAYASQDIPNAPNYTSYQDVFNASINTLVGPPKDILGLSIDSNGIISSNNLDTQNVVDTQNLDAEGVEFELVGNITDNWTVSLNVAKQEVVVSDVIPLLAEFAFETRDRMIEAGLYDLYTDWDPTERTKSEQGFKINFLNQLGPKVLALLAREGQTSPEVRKWRYNFMTNYQFNEDTWLRGFGVGGALRWQDEIAIGYDQAFDAADDLWKPILNRPYFGSDQLNGDIWITYQRPLGDRINWKVQLNVQNLVGDDDPVAVQADVDGEIIFFRNPPPRVFFVTNTFSF